MPVGVWSEMCGSHDVDLLLVKMVQLVSYHQLNHCQEKVFRLNIGDTKISYSQKHYPLMPCESFP